LEDITIDFGFALLKATHYYIFKEPSSVSDQIENTSGDLSEISGF
jgi:hypothetical protein